MKTVALLSIIGSATATSVTWGSAMWDPAATAGDRGTAATVFKFTVTPATVPAGVTGGTRFQLDASATPTTSAMPAGYAASDGIFPYGDPVCTAMQGTTAITIASASTASSGTTPTDSASGYSRLYVTTTSDAAGTLTAAVACDVTCTWSALTGTSTNVYNGAAGEVIAFSAESSDDTTAITGQVGYTIAAAANDLMCHAPVDIVFILDESVSVGSTNYNRSIDFMMNMVMRFNVGTDTTDAQIAMVKFSTLSTLSFNLNDHTTNADVVAAMAATQFNSWAPLGGACPFYSMKMASDQVLCTNCPGRSPRNAPSIAVFLTDSNPWLYDSCAGLNTYTYINRISEIIRLKSLVDRIIPVGIGSGIAGAYLLSLSKNMPVQANGNVYITAEYSDLDAILNDTVALACPTQLPTKAPTYHLLGSPTSAPTTCVSTHVHLPSRAHSRRDVSTPVASYSRLVDLAPRPTSAAACILGTFRRSRRPHRRVRRRTGTKCLTARTAKMIRCRRQR